MTREEEIQKAATESCSKYNMPYGVPSFIEGAEWADAHPAKKQAVTIDAWVARDFNNILGIYGKQPRRGCASYCGDFKCLIDEKLFPSITFQNSPKKVKVTIELEDEV